MEYFTSETLEAFLIKDPNKIPLSEKGKNLLSGFCSGNCSVFDFINALQCKISFLLYDTGNASKCDSYIISV